ncbi:MAG TPA: hypothetical protein VGB22_06655 [candidate division Zixibacteria bacterium]|jgi:hypothetical protein
MSLETVSTVSSGHTKPASVPTQDDLYWLEAMRQIRTGVMRSAEVAALGVLAWSVLGWLAVVLGLIFGPLALSGATAARVIMWLSPMIWWALSGLWALRVLLVRRYRYFANSPDSSRRAIERITRRKIEDLYWAIGLWAAGVISLLCAICLALLRPL